jgi:hypothetical protein
MEVVPFGGWERVARIVSGDVELFVTLDVGPRIVRLGVIGGPNEFYENPDNFGKTGGDHYRSYGGHRLWIAPEIPERTLQPDNESIDFWEEDQWFVFSMKPDRWNVQKQIWVQPLGHGEFWVEHRLVNLTPYTIDIASWAVTQMTGGGLGYFPMPEFKPHTDEVLPSRPLVLWGYTDLSDSRFLFSPNLCVVRQDATGSPQKLGSFVSQGYAAYANRGNLFIKRFDTVSWGDRGYPDFGCNFELFTNSRFLELESLGPMVELTPGSTIAHYESWRLFQNVQVPSDTTEALTLIANKAQEVTKGLWLVIQSENGAEQTSQSGKPLEEAEINVTLDVEEPVAHLPRAKWHLSHEGNG